MQFRFYLYIILTLNVLVLKSHPMRHKHPHRVRVIRIDVEDVRLAKEIGQQQIVFTAVPFASDPSDAVHEAKCR